MVAPADDDSLLRAFEDVVADDAAARYVAKVARLRAAGRLPRLEPGSKSHAFLLDYMFEAERAEGRAHVVYVGREAPLPSDALPPKATARSYRDDAFIPPEVVRAFAEYRSLSAPDWPPDVVLIQSGTDAVAAGLRRLVPSAATDAVVMIYAIRKMYMTLTFLMAVAGVPRARAGKRVDGSAAASRRRRAPVDASRR